MLGLGIGGQEVHLIALMRLLIVVNVGWFFISHRLPVAIAAERLGYEVHVATTITKHRSLLDSYGFIVHPIVVDRGNSQPINNLKLLGTLLGLFWRVRPDVVHLVTIKAMVLWVVGL